MTTEAQEKLTLRPHQARFLDAAEPYVGLFGGVGNGKTFVANLKIIEHATQNPNNLCLVGRLTYPELRDSTREVFMSVLQKFLPEKAYQFNRAENSVTFWNGSVVIFRHLDNPASLLGPNLGAFYIDQAEEVDEEAFLQLQSRLRRPNIRFRQGLITGNPHGHDWIYYRWGMNDNPEGLNDWSYNTDYRMFTAPTIANVDNLPAGYIEQLKRSYSNEWFQRYVMGSWDVFEDQIFDITKIKGFTELPEIKLIFTACDPAISKEKTACNTAFCTVGVGVDGKLYDLETVADKWNFEETLNQADRIMNNDKYAVGGQTLTIRCPDYLGVEDVGYQRALYEACARYFTRTGATILDLKADRDKFRRAKSVSHMVTRGLFHSNNKQLLDELSAFTPDSPSGSRKDRVDALVHALHMVQKYSPVKFDAPAHTPEYMQKPRHERFFWKAFKQEKEELRDNGEMRRSVQEFSPADRPLDPDFY